MHLPSLSLVATSFCAVIALVGCSHDVPATSMAWKVTPASEGMVNVSFVMSGVLVQEVPLGTFDGEAIDEEDLLYREWWAGSQEALSVERKDASHLVIMRTPLEGEEESRELTSITVPTGLRVECVDTGSCG